MWFDAHAKLAEIAGELPATSATLATQAPAAHPLSQMSQRPANGMRASGVASVATVATPPRSKSEPVRPARADGLDSDAGAYLDRLHLHGPATYGAMASAMKWGATRAWQAEAALRAAGLVQMRLDGRAEPAPKKGNP